VAPYIVFASTVLAMAVCEPIHHKPATWIEMFFGTQDSLDLSYT